MTLRVLAVPLSFLFTIPLTAMHDPAQAGFIIVMLATALLTTPLRAFIHEAGHAFAARLRGHVVWAARVGSGPILHRFRLAGVAFDVLRYPWVGGRVFYVDPTGRNRRRDLAFIAAAGPGANLMAGLAAFALSWLIQDDGGLSACLGGLGLFNLVMGIFNLIPRRTGDHEATVSDGQLILNAFGPKPPPTTPWIVDMCRVMAYQHQHRHEEALAVACETWLQSPGRMVLANSLLHNLSRARGDRAVIDFYCAHEDEMLPGPADDGTQLTWIQANVAWSALKLHDSGLIELAERTATAAWKRCPDHPEIEGTYGAWLVSAGRAEEGTACLTRAIRGIRDRQDRLDFCRFLADGWRRRGDDARAEVYRALEKRYLRETTS